MSEREKRRLILGCDIGNGYAYISVLSDPKLDPIPLLPGKYSGLAKIGMPTAAYIVPPSGEKIEVFSGGKAAEDKYRSKPEQMIRAIKTRMKEGAVSVPGIVKPVEVRRIISAVAKDLISLAEEELAGKGLDPVYDVVFTFPAAFSDDTELLEQMQNSIESIEINGHRIRVLGRIPEPAAVAIDYLHYMQHIAPEGVRINSDRYTVLVYDLGHGTFDTAVVTAKSDGVPYLLHSKAGLPEVGGKNFDQLLYQEILDQLQEQYGYIPQNERHRELVRKEAVKAKIALTTSRVYTASVVNDGSYCEVDITLERFEELSRHLVLQTLELVQSVLDESASLGIRIDGIVLSGGASQMPMIKDNLKQLVEDSYPISLFRPSEAVSFGAARYAYGLSDEKPVHADATEESDNEEKGAGNHVMEQKTDCCYGIWMPARRKLQGEVRLMIPSGEIRPFRSEPVSFHSGSSRVVIRVYRSAEKNKKTAAVDDCESMLWMPFDVTPGAKCEVTVIALENYDIQIELTTDQGDSYKKKTSDILEKII